MANQDRRSALASGLAAAAAGALGALPGAAGRADPVAHLVWLALLAPAAGALCSARGPRLLPLGWLVPLAWFAPLAWVSARAPHALPTPVGALMAWCGLYALGAALGECARRRAWDAFATGGAALLAGLLLALLPARGALTGVAWPPAAARVLFDLAPTSLVVESAGVDWMRHAASYDAVATDRFERRAWRGPLAGSVLVLVGCALALGASRVPVRASAPGVDA